MRTTVDIDDRVYAQLKSRAALESTSVKALISHAVERLVTSSEQKSRPRKRLPLIGVSSPGTLPIDHDSIAELLDV